VEFSEWKLVLWFSPTWRHNWESRGQATGLWHLWHLEASLTKNTKNFTSGINGVYVTLYRLSSKIKGNQNLQGGDNHVWLLLSPIAWKFWKQDIVSSSTRDIDDVSVLRVEIALFWNVTPWQDLLTLGQLNLFLNVFSLQRKDPSKLAGNWFQLLMVLFTKDYLPTSVLCFLVLIFRLLSSLLR
jgi:hypothetical protein